MDLSKYRQLMDKSIEHLRHELWWIHVGRATSSLVDNISVTVSYGSMKINQLANVVVMDAQTLKVEPWDKSVSSAIQTAIYDAGTGLSPTNEGDYVLIKVPPLTKERREQLSKQVSKLWEESKISVRNARHEAQKDVKKMFDEKEISEDQKKWYENKIDELTKEMTAKIDTIVKNKTEDVMSE